MSIGGAKDTPRNAAGIQETASIAIVVVAASSQNAAGCVILMGERLEIDTSGNAM